MERPHFILGSMQAPDIIGLHDSEDSEEETGPAAAISPARKTRPLRTLLDCPTRWSSCWRMLTRLVKLKDDIRSVLRDGGSPELDLSDDAWADLAILCRILAPFSNAVRVWEGEKYSTLSLVWPLSENLTEFLTTSNPCPDDQPFPTWDEVACEFPASQSVRLKLMEEIARADRFGDLSNPIKIATMLDPRMKDLDFLPKSRRTPAFNILLGELEQEEQSEEAGPASYSVMVMAALFPARSTSLPSHPQERPDVANELQRYRAHPVVCSNLSEFSILSWWRSHENVYPTLAALAKTYLALPASPAPSERVFSKVNVGGGMHNSRDERPVLKHNKHFY